MLDPSILVEWGVKGVLALIAGTVLYLSWRSGVKAEARVEELEDDIKILRFREKLHGQPMPSDDQLVDAINRMFDN